MTSKTTKIIDAINELESVSFDTLQTIIFNASMLEDENAAEKALKKYIKTSRSLPNYGPTAKDVDYGAICEHILISDIED